MEFYDIFWDEENLTDSEKSNYHKDTEIRLKEYFDKYEFINSNQPYKCPLCQENSEVKSYEGNINLAICPKCKGTFKPPSIGDVLISALYWKNL